MKGDDTIAAIATAPGRGGVGIVRISGPNSHSIAKKILGFSPRPRYAHHCNFSDTRGAIVDSGIALYFSAPHSFTGENVLELQGHGGAIVMQLLLQSALDAGARLAQPGEFSQRAFLNDKMDLAQVEAIADLINASSRQAAKQALNSLQGKFSEFIQELAINIVTLRIFVESAIDFPEEEVDFLGDAGTGDQLNALIHQLESIQAQAQQGALLRDGIKLVLAGRPNAGKSSLLNQLAGRESAIVTDIAGTTRDLVHEQIFIDGIAVQITDTAGLRDSEDPVEALGIARAHQEILQADHVLLLIDTTDPEQIAIESHWNEVLEKDNLRSKVTLVMNKIDDANSKKPVLKNRKETKLLAISARTGEGIEELRDHLREVCGIKNTAEASFIARKRHMIALQKCSQYLLSATNQLHAGELLAQDLREAHDALGEITGKMLPDELLGEIFSSFCIGK